MISVFEPGAYRLAPWHRLVRASSNDSDGSRSTNSLRRVPLALDPQHTSDTILAEASLVVEQDDSELPLVVEAKPILRRKVAALLILIMLIIATLVVGLSAGLSRKSTVVIAMAAPKSELSPAPTPQMITAREMADELRRSLPSRTLQSIDSPNSSQSKAFQWLTADERPPIPAEGSLFRMAQQFALATLHYATDGELGSTTRTG